MSGKSEEKQSTMRRKSTLNHTLEYSYRGKLPLRLECDVAMAPFEAIDFKLLLTFHKINVMREGGSNVELKFNFMNIDDMQTKCIVLYRDSNISGEYGLAESSLNVEFSATREKHVKDQRAKLLRQLPQELIDANAATELSIFKVPGGLIHEQRVYAWRYVTYKFKMYRYPINIIILIFVPLWILSFTNIVIFWASPADVSGRLQTISGLMIAYAALLPTIRDKIPPSPNITLLEYMVYSLSFTIFLSSLETLIAAVDNVNPPGYIFVWYRNWRFMLSIVITIGTMVIFFTLGVIYKCVWEPRYNFVKDSKVGLEFENFTVDGEVWSNEEASGYLKDKTRIVGPEDGERGMQREMGAVNEKKGNWGKGERREDESYAVRNPMMASYGNRGYVVNGRNNNDDNGKDEDNGRQRIRSLSPIRTVQNTGASNFGNQNFTNNLTNQNKNMNSNFNSNNTNQNTNQIQQQFFPQGSNQNQNQNQTPNQKIQNQNQFQNPNQNLSMNQILSQNLNQVQHHNPNQIFNPNLHQMQNRTLNQPQPQSINHLQTQNPPQYSPNRYPTSQPSNSP